MKTFKQFKSSLDKKKVKWKESPIHFKSAFSEHPISVRKNTSLDKKKVKWKESPIHFKSAFSEHPTKVRKNTSSKKVNEEFIPFREKHIIHNGVWHNSEHDAYDKDNGYGASYDGDFHDHEDVKPQKLEEHHTQAIRNYCYEPNGHGSSANINGMLRNMDGDKSSRVMHQNPEDVKKSIQHLSSAFTKDNTNRKEITTWGGIPPHIGKKLMKDGAGSHHHLSGFTSTSSSKETAVAFGRKYNENSDSDSDNEDRPLHVIQYHIKPGAGLSAVHHSEFSENEVMLHHGVHIEYHGHQVIQHSPDRYSGYQVIQHSPDQYSGHQVIQHSPDQYSGHEKIYLHHVTVHPEHKSLDEYGQYDHPKD